MTDQSSTNVTRMMAFLDRIERVEDEIAALRQDAKEIWAEAKGAGYSVKHLRRAHALRKMDKADRDQLAVYVAALQLFE
jgi:uncharacterized protein (UPF0335 family)